MHVQNPLIMTPLRLTAAALLLAAITTTYATRPATAQPKSFAGFTELAYGTPRALVAKTLAAAGYTFDSIGHYNDDLYIGNVDSLRTDLFSYYDDHGDVAKITVNYETADADAHETYDRMRQDLITRFGPPRMTYAFYKRPYTASDDLRALQSGNGFFLSAPG